MTKKISDLVAEVVSYVTSILFAILVGIVVVQVVLRYVFNSGISWSEEMARYLFVWVSFLGISIAFRKHSHIAVDSLKDAIPKMKNILDAFYYCTIICFLIFLLIFGMVYTLDNTKVDSTLLPITMAHVYSIIPIASALSLLFIICELISKWNARKREGGSVQWR